MTLASHVIWILLSDLLDRLIRVPLLLDLLLANPRVIRLDDTCRLEGSA